MWRGIWAITNYRITPTACSNDADFLNDLNNFFGGFEALNSTSAVKAVPRQDEKALCLNTVDVRRPQRRVNT